VLLNLLGLNRLKCLSTGGWAPPSLSGVVGPECGLKVCSSKKFPGDAYFATLGTTL
jgi:hypothetical protein